MRKYAWGITNMLLAVAILAAAYILLFQRQELVDWWRLRNYTPSVAIAELASNVGFTPQGKQHFYASQPVVEASETFNNHCKNDGEESLVLGCYRGQLIYIFDVTDPKLAGVKEVTAAHEMLHAAYDRLGDQERAQVNELVSAQLGNIDDERLKELIKLYNEREPGELLNEMHSILGTEYRNVSPALETYYKKYFADRIKVVNYADAYAAVFNASKQRLADYDAQLAQLKTQIDANNAQLQRDKAELDQTSDELDTLRRTDRESYNARVPQYNAEVRAYNMLVSRTQELIAKYNELVVVRNGEAAAQNNLYRSLNSNPQEVQAN